MTSHQVRIHENGGPAVLRHEASAAGIGTPGHGQVRLRHEAIGLNFVDTLFRSGAIPVTFPFAMGVEGAGIVEAVGSDVHGIEVGDRVAYFFSFGAYADVRLIDAAALVKLPADVPARVAASLMAKGLTAWMMLRRVHAVRPGEAVLVTGAAGGVGLLTAHWAQALGARVIALVGSPAKASFLRNRGFAHVLEGGDPSFDAQVHAITQGKGVDAAFELVGTATFGQSARALRDGGDMVHLGNASGMPSDEEKAQLAERSIRHVQPSTGQYVKDRQSLEEASAEVFAAYREGVFGKVDPAVYPLAEAARAHEDIAARRITGPAVLLP